MSETLPDSADMLAFDALPGLAWLCHADGECRYVSARWKEYTGRPPSEHLGRGWLRVVHPDDRQEVAASWAIAVTREQTYRSVHRVLRHDGMYRWFRAHAAPMRNSRGRLAGFSGLSIDIDAEIKREEVCRLVVESADLGVFDVDLVANCAEWSPRCKALFGLCPGDAPVYFDDFLRAVHDEDRDRVRVEVLRLMEVEGREHLLEYRTVWPDGSVHWVSSWARVYFGTVGGIRRAVRLLGTAEDISERKRSELALMESKQCLEAADRHKTEFLATLSHELRNPLAPIRNGVYILERAAPGSDRALRARAVIERQTQHMTRLIDDLLDVTRISRGKINLQRTRVELVSLVRSAADDHREAFERNGVQLAIIDADRPLDVLGDATRLAQVVGNLLGNAAKFTSRGGHTTVSVRRSDAGDAVIRVRDDGVGLAPEMLSRLFQPFVQAEKTLDRSHGGLGLGLAVVKGLVEMHGGSITADSQGLGKGAEFVVRLPLALEPPQPVPTGRPHRAGPVVGCRVLVIEDNPDAASSLREVLELDEHRVEVALNGLDGIARAKQFKPDVVLCDLGLPGADGYAVARALRAEPSLAKTQLIALSGYAHTDDVEKARAAGFAHHMAKPPDLGRLEQLLHDVASRVPPSCD